MKRKLTKATLSELELHCEIMKLFEQKGVVGGGSGSTYSMEEYLRMTAEGNWTGGYVEGVGYVGANDNMNWDSDGNANMGSYTSGYGSDYYYGSGDYGNSYSDYGSGYFGSSDSSYGSYSQGRPHIETMTWKQLTELSFPTGYFDNALYEILKHFPVAGSMMSSMYEKLNKQLTALILQITPHVNDQKQVTLLTRSDIKGNNVFSIMQISYIDKDTHGTFTKNSIVQFL